MKQLNLNLSNNNNKNTKPKLSSNPTHKAFTIIEVVLVLAIAGLIFLMVFIALPALQRNQRDTQRKNDMSRVLTAINSYQSNNKGNIPSDFSAELVGNYLKVSGDTFADPDGSGYSFVWGTVGTIPTKRKSDATGNTLIYRFSNAKCDKENTVAKTRSNNVALSIMLEGGGVYCVNN